MTITTMIGHHDLLESVVKIMLALSKCELAVKGLETATKTVQPVVYFTDPLALSGVLYTY